MCANHTEYSHMKEHDTIPVDKSPVNAFSREVEKVLSLVTCQLGPHVCVSIANFGCKVLPRLNR